MDESTHRKDQNPPDPVAGRGQDECSWVQKRDKETKGRTSESSCSPTWLGSHLLASLQAKTIITIYLRLLIPILKEMPGYMKIYHGIRRNSSNLLVIG